MTTPERKIVTDGQIIWCPTCNKAYKISMKRIHLPGAGSAADWLTVYLPCGHTSTEEYDDNRHHITGITET
jgi:hypothetical protein